MDLFVSIAAIEQGWMESVAAREPDAATIEDCSR